MLLICLLVWFTIFNASSDTISPQCDGKNSFVYYNNSCMYFKNTTSEYYDLFDLSLLSITESCSWYWKMEYGNNVWKQKCSNLNKLVWPVGVCYCPRCDCISSLCCYNNVYGEFNKNDWAKRALQIPCDNEQDMCLYKVDSNGISSVACSNSITADNTLSMSIKDEKSVILKENNNTACYTFIDNNITTLYCFCEGNGCNNLYDVQPPNLMLSNECYISVSDSFHNEEFWIQYVVQDDSCPMCSVSMSQSNESSLVQMKCSSRQHCYSLLTKYNTYNDELIGCVVTSNEPYIIRECCCDPSIHGKLCNQKFVSESKKTTYFQCWKAPFLDISNNNWQLAASQTNCSTEFHDYCYIESFGNNIYSSNCATKSYCNNQANTNVICCNDTNFCNNPSLFKF